MSCEISMGSLKVGGSNPLLLIAGPCVAESYDLCMQVGSHMKTLCDANGISYVFKASFDKANRSSIHSRRGPGMHEGLALIEKVGKELGTPTTTDLHEPQQAKAVGEAVDVLQIPAFLCRQTDLLVAAAETGKTVNVKKGQFLSPFEMKQVVSKLNESKATGIMLTERGTFFGYNRLVNDFIGIGDMMNLGCPVCFDVTHSTQLPGAEGTSTGGRPDRAPMLATAATAIGVDALFIEVHPNPSEAFSDAATQLPLSQAAKLIERISRIRNAITN